MNSDTNNEATFLDNSPLAFEQVSDNNESKNWRNVVISGVAGIALGGVGAALASATTAEVEDAQEPTVNENAPQIPENIPMSNSVNDDMSFGEAFAAARHDVGSGGVFVWHGGTYGTYYQDEWAALTPEQRSEFSNQFGSASTHHAEHHIQEQPVEAQVVESTEPVATENGDNVEVLGVVHDARLDADVAVLEVYEQKVVLVDTDHDTNFDVAIADLNHDGQITSNEIADISDQGITVEGLGGYTDPNANLYTTDTTDTIDPVDTGGEVLTI